MRACTIGAQVGHIGVGHRIHEGVVKDRVVGAAGAAVGVEAQDGITRTHRDGHAARDQLPAIGRILRIDLLVADQHAIAVQEDQGDGACIAGVFSGRAHTATKGQVDQSRIELRGGVARSDQVDGLLGSALRHAAGREILLAVVSARCGHRAAGIDRPAIDAIFKAGVDQQVAIERWHGLVQRHVRGFHIGAGEAQAGGGVEQAVVVAMNVAELGLGPLGVDHRSTDGMQIKAGHIGLPVQHVGEVLGPVHQLAVAGLVQVVVVAEEASLRIVGHVNVVA